MKIFFVPIEPFEERYSAQWLRWFEREFRKNDIEYLTILPENRMADSIREGEFLDIIGTNHFKAQQLQKLCELIDVGVISNEDVILVEDYWFPGIEMLGYMRDALELDFKIAGMLHAGTWDPNDFITQKGMRSWARNIEEGWFKLADVIFVATNYHKDLILDGTYIEDVTKIKVTGFPLYSDFLVEEEYFCAASMFPKKNQIIFPHRFAPEKNSEIWLEIQQLAKEDLLHDWSFIDTQKITSKNQYYTLLAESKIVLSLAYQETWGIAQQEGVLLGCHPFMPNRLAYTEMYPSYYLYNQENCRNDQQIASDCHFQLCEFILDLEKSPDLYKERQQKLVQLITIKGSNAIPNMLVHLLQL